MPEHGIKKIPHEDILSFEEIVSFTKKAVELGIDKVRLTGGEPLVRRDIAKLVAMLSKIRGINDLAMTTNGVLLKDFAEPLVDAGLHRVNISLDTLDPKRYSEITRGGDIKLVLKGIEKAKMAGLNPIKLNCVFEKSSKESDAQMVKQYALENGLDARFIRRMDIKRGYFWKVEGGNGGDCQHCNRLRLSSDGRIFPCLFSDLSFSIKGLGIEEAIKRAVKAKPESGLCSSNSFNAIGG